MKDQFVILNAKMIPTIFSQINHPGEDASVTTKKVAGGPELITIVNHHQSTQSAPSFHLSQTNGLNISATTSQAITTEPPVLLHVMTDGDLIKGDTTSSADVRGNEVNILAPGQKVGLKINIVSPLHLGTGNGYVLTTKPTVEAKMYPSSSLTITKLINGLTIPYLSKSPSPAENDEAFQCSKNSKNTFLLQK